MMAYWLVSAFTKLKPYKFSYSQKVIKQAVMLVTVITFIGR